MPLVLFDIDGTLMLSGGAGTKAMLFAFEEVYGAGNGFDGISMSGKTDPAILREAIERSDCEWDHERVERFKEIYFRRLESEIRQPLPGKRLLPGVALLLESLRDRSGIVVGLLTGNWERSAHEKLRYFGIDGFFGSGAFADDSEDRDALLPVAKKRAEAMTGRRFPPDAIWVVGDTPRDVQCARVHGAKALAVSTGLVSHEELSLTDATALLPDLSNTEQVLTILLGGPAVA